MLKRGHAQLEESEKNIETKFHENKKNKFELHASLVEFYRVNRNCNLTSSPYRISTQWLSDFLRVTDPNDKNSKPFENRPVVLASGSAGERVSKQVYLKLAEEYGVDENLCALRFGAAFSSEPLKTKEVDKTKSVEEVVGPGDLFLCSNSSEYPTESELKFGRMVSKETRVENLQLLPTESVVRVVQNRTNTQLSHSESDLTKLPYGLVGLVDKHKPKSSFVNSSLQALFHIPQIVFLFCGPNFNTLINQNNNSGYNGRLALFFANFVRKYYTTTAPALNTSPVIYLLSSVQYFFPKYLIQDAFEFIVFLLESLHEELRVEKFSFESDETNMALEVKVQNKVEIDNEQSVNNQFQESSTPHLYNISGSVSYIENEISKAAKTSWGEFLAEKGTSPINQIFMGMQENSVQCLHCHNITATFESFMNVRLPIPGERPKLRDVVIMLNNVNLPLLRTRVSIPQLGTIADIKEQLKDILPDLANSVGNLIACEVFDGKVYKVLEDNDIVANKVQDCDDLVIYEVEKPKMCEKTIPCFLSSADVGFALPFYLNVNEEEFSKGNINYMNDISHKIQQKIIQQAYNPPVIKEVIPYYGTIEQFVEDHCHSLSDYYEDDDDDDESGNDYSEIDEKNSNDNKGNNYRNGLNEDQYKNRTNLFEHIEKVRKYEDENSKSVKKIENDEILNNSNAKSKGEDIKHADIKNNSKEDDLDDAKLSVNKDVRNDDIVKIHESEEHHNRILTEPTNINNSEGLNDNKNIRGEENIQSTHSTSSVDSSHNSIGILFIEIGDFSQAVLKKANEIINKHTISPLTISSNFSPNSELSSSPLTNGNTSEKISIYSCLEQFSNPQLNQNYTKEQWFCRKCHALRIPKQKIIFWKLPEILMIQLKRFPTFYNLSRKIEDLIDFPLNGLDLGDYTNPQYKGSSQYDLLAVVSHHEEGVGTHHYTTLVRDLMNGNPEWVQFRDAYVTPVHNVDASSGYVLYYMKRGNGEASQTDVAVQQAKGLIAELRSKIE